MDSKKYKVGFILYKLFLSPLSTYQVFVVDGWGTPRKIWILPRSLFVNAALSLVPLALLFWHNCYQDDCKPHESNSSTSCSSFSSGHWM